MADCPTRLFYGLAVALHMEIAHWIENCRQDREPLAALVRLAQSVASSPDIIPGLCLLDAIGVARASLGAREESD